MNEFSEPQEQWDTLREKIIGLGELSFRKSYYPELQDRLDELERFKALLEQGHDSIFLFHIATRTIVDANHSACSLMDLEADEIKGLRISSLSGRPNIANLMEIFKTTNLTGESGAIAINIPKPEDRTIFLEVNRRLVEFNGDRYLVIAARDVSGRKRIEKEKETILYISRLFLESDSLEHVYERLPMLLSEEFSFPFVLIEVKDMITGKLKAAGSVGLDFSGVIEEDDCSNGENDKSSQLNNCRVETSNDPIQGIDEIFPVKEEIRTYICVPMKIHHRTIGTLRLADTHRREYVPSMADAFQLIANHLAQEIERKRATQALTRINRELFDFSGRVSHSIKSHLNLLMGYLHLAGEDPDSLIKNAAMLGDRIRLLSKMVDDLLKLSRAGMTIGKKQEVKLSLLAKGFFAILSNISGLKAEIIIKDDGNDIKADPEGIEEIFHNLMDNSFKFRDQEHQLVIEVETRRKNGEAVIYYRDNGKGFVSIDPRLVFDMGLTGDPSRGSGFGLSIVKKIIEAHQGRINARNRKNSQGVEFEIHIPQ